MRFYSQQILATLALAAVWIGAIIVLGGSLQPKPLTSNEQLNVVKTAKKPRVEHEPRDPKTTGETARRHFKDENGSERRTEVEFADKGSAVVEYSVFGKPFRVTETSKDGSVMLFQLDPMGSRLLRIESKRADGTLKTVVQPSEGGAFERVFFQDNGKTKACRQLLNPDGSMTADIYGQDGKWVCARYKLDASQKAVPNGVPNAEYSQSGYQQPAPPVSAVLQVFDKTGKIVREETVARQNQYEGDCGEGCEGGYYQETVSVKVFKAERLQSEEEWQSYPGGSPSLTSAIEYASDGKTKLRTLSSCYETVGKEHASQRLDNFDSKGKCQRSQFLDNNGNVMMEKTASASGEQTSYPKPTKAVNVPAPAPPSYKQLPQEFFDNKPEPNRLQQVLK